MELSNSVRYFYYISGVFRSQNSDPLCSNCKALANSVNAVSEHIKEFEERHLQKIRELPVELSQIFFEAKNNLSSVKVPQNAAGQKKAGNCRMPEGVCFVKTSKKMIERLS